MPLRKIVIIDEEKCDGCGLCVDACHEGAIELRDGKAVLVSEILCDGFGDCLGECPQGALTIEERDVAAYSQEAVDAHLAQKKRAAVGGGGGAHLPMAGAAPSGVSRAHGGAVHACPGSAARTLAPQGTFASETGLEAASAPSALGNWPVQIHLAPVQAPYFAGARLLVAADCVPFAYAGFHQTLLAGRTLLVGCPKLDDTSAYVEKLAAIFRFNDIESVEIAVMEVPCCSGLLRLVEQAVAASGKAEALRPTFTRVGIRGELQLRDQPL